MTRPIEYAPTAQGISDAADVLRAGGTVAFPTETVYGLGADATNPTAVAAIYAAKGRPSFNPLIAHVGSPDHLDGLVQMTDLAKRVMAAFWPGPLTLVLPLDPAARVAQATTAGLPTLAVRMPSHPVARALLAAVDRPVAAPSANPSGRISPTTAQHVRDGLSGRIDGLIDGGRCDRGLESTILSLDPAPMILRPGHVTAADLEPVIGAPVATAASATGPVTAPGQLASHYAPNAPVALNVKTATPGVFLIGFGDVAGDITLSANGDLAEAAEQLFAALRMADASGQPIAVAPIPMDGIGLAINDRLTRAAAPRD